jgi:hypothetical protein
MSLTVADLAVAPQKLGEADLSTVKELMCVLISKIEDEKSLVDAKADIHRIFEHIGTRFESKKGVTLQTKLVEPPAAAPPAASPTVSPTVSKALDFAKMMMDITTTLSAINK